MCDGFTGNVILKLTEGLIKYFQDWMSSNEIIKNNTEILNIINSILDNYNYEEHGASPFLGVKGIVLKCHGACSEVSIENSLKIAHVFCKEQLIVKIENDLMNNASLTINHNKVSMLNKKVRKLKNQCQQEKKS